MVETREAAHQLKQRQIELAISGREATAADRRDGKLGAKSVGQVAVATARATTKRKSSRHGITVPDGVKAVAPMIPAAFCISVMFVAGLIISSFSSMSTGE